MSAIVCSAAERMSDCGAFTTTPPRRVAGFLPGTRDAGAFETVPFSAAHAWVEVYFRGIGWVTFDPNPAAAPASSQPDNEDAGGFFRGRSSGDEQGNGRCRELERARDVGRAEHLRRRVAEEVGAPDGERRELHRLAALAPGIPVLEVPLLDSDVASLAALRAVVEELDDDERRQLREAFARVPRSAWVTMPRTLWRLRKKLRKTV